MCIPKEENFPDKDIEFQKNDISVVTRRSLLGGVLLILVSNLVYIGNNYFVKLLSLPATEVLLVRGLIQVLLFSCLLAVQRYTASSTTTNKKIYTHKVIGMLVVYSLMMSTQCFAALYALPMMPIGDLIVISFASPAFTVFIARAFLSTPLTILSVTLSFLILCGDTLVIQPPFLFETAQERDSLYFVGVGLCLYVAVAAAIADNASAYCSKAGVPTSVLMIGSGTASIATSASIILYEVVRSSVSSTPGNAFKLSFDSAPYLLCSGLMVMLAFWWVAAALALTRNPTLVGMLRTTEILFAMVTESFINAELPNPLSCTGSLLVLLCVLCMSVHDNIINFANNKIRRRRNSKSSDLIQPL